ncbi:hypothetical protein GW17_00004046 [Ensete ventricosum]|nr:hypothetical protein GW17_00004046 [Ensete ventricosum]
MMATWSGSERKLLFDLVNCSLVGIIAPHIDLHPWVRSKKKSMHRWEPEGLVERLWEMVVKQRKELGCNLEDKILDPRWLDVEDDTDVIVKEIERMLNDDLWEETWKATSSDGPDVGTVHSSRSNCWRGSSRVAASSLLPPHFLDHPTTYDIRVGDPVQLFSDPVTLTRCGAHSSDGSDVGIVRFE